MWQCGPVVNVISKDYQPLPIRLKHHNVNGFMSIIKYSNKTIMCFANENGTGTASEIDKSRKCKMKLIRSSFGFALRINLFSSPVFHVIVGEQLRIDISFGRAKCMKYFEILVEKLITQSCYMMQMEDMNGIPNMIMIT